MATDVNVSDYTNYVGSKHPTPQALISSARKGLIYVVKLTFDAVYPSGGYTDANLKQLGAKNIDFVIWGNHPGGPDPYYDKDTGNIAFYTEDGNELSSGSNLIDGIEYDVLVFARS